MWKTWGVRYNQDFPYSKDWRCRECGWSFFDEDTEKSGPCVVGFSTDYTVHSSQFGVAGVLIVECPKCFSKFFFHVTHLLLKSVVYAMPQWPDQCKHDDAKE